MKKICSVLAAVIMFYGSCYAADKFKKTPQGLLIPWTEEQKKAELKNTLHRYGFTEYTVLTEAARHIETKVFKTQDELPGDDMRVSQICIGDADDTVYEVATKPIIKKMFLHTEKEEPPTSLDIRVNLPRLLFPEDIQDRLDDFKRKYSDAKIQSIIYGDSVKEECGPKEKWLLLPGKGRECYVTVPKDYNGTASWRDREKRKTCLGKFYALFWK